MSFTQEEEDTLRLIISELKARQKLNAKNKQLFDEINGIFRPLDTSTREKYKADFDKLQADFFAAEKAIEDAFK